MMWLFKINQSVSHLELRGKELTWDLSCVSIMCSCLLMKHTGPGLTLRVHCTCTEKTWACVCSAHLHTPYLWGLPAWTPACLSEAFSSLLYLSMICCTEPLISCDRSAGDRPYSSGSIQRWESSEKQFQKWDSEAALFWRIMTLIQDGF